MRAAFASRIGTRAAEAKTLHEISVPPICCPRPARRPSWPCIRTGVAQGRCLRCGQRWDARRLDTSAGLSPRTVPFATARIGRCCEVARPSDGLAKCFLGSRQDRGPGNRVRRLAHREFGHVWIRAVQETAAQSDLQQPAVRSMKWVGDFSRLESTTWRWWPRFVPDGTACSPGSNWFERSRTPRERPAQRLTLF